jgi:hypothetical protein
MCLYCYMSTQRYTEFRGELYSYGPMHLARLGQFSGCWELGDVDGLTETEPRQQRAGRRRYAR